MLLPFFLCLFIGTVLHLLWFVSLDLPSGEFNDISMMIIKLAIST